MGMGECEENYQVELISVICYLHLPARRTPCVNFFENRIEEMGEKERARYRNLATRQATDGLGWATLSNTDLEFLQ